MEQKNTIVRCTAHPKCLFNHNGVCDNHVITIGPDGNCQEYVETENVTIRPALCEQCGHYEDYGLLQNPCNKLECYRHRKDNACVDFIAIRGQRAKGKIFDDIYDAEYEELFNATKNMLKSSGVELKQENQMCWYCDHGEHGKCSFLVKPIKDSNGECCRFTSTGGNR